MRAVRACLAAVALLLACAAPAAAAAPTAADREAARGLATRGYDAFKDGAYARAIDLFQQAEARVHAPPHWMYMARSQAKLGRLLEAKHSYERILAEKLADSAPAPFKEAQTAAKGELEEVNALLPSLEVTLSGEGMQTAQVTIDDVPLPAEQLGHAAPYDPGPHTVVVVVGAAPPIARRVVLKAGGDLEHVLIPLGVPPSRSAAPTIVAFTLGGLALGAGGVTLGLYLSAKAPRSQALEIASIASFAGGAVGVGVGIALAARGPAEPAAAARVTIRLGVGSLALGGEF